jgi:hypothetical protein
MLNIASFTLSDVGLVLIPGTAFSPLPLALPDITRIVLLFTLLLPDS